MATKLISQSTVDLTVDLAKKIAPQDLEKWKANLQIIYQIAFAGFFTFAIVLTYKAIAGASLSWVGISAVFLIMTLAAKKLVEALETKHKYFSFRAGISTVMVHLEKTGKDPALLETLQKYN